MNDVHYDNSRGIVTRPFSIIIIISIFHTKFYDLFFLSLMSFLFLKQTYINALNSYNFRTLHCTNCSHESYFSCVWEEWRDFGHFRSWKVICRGVVFTLVTHVANRKKNTTFFTLLVQVTRLFCCTNYVYIYVLFWRQIEPGPIISNKRSKKYQKTIL